MNLIILYVAGVVSGVVLGWLTRSFHWSVVDEPETMFNQKRLMWKRIIVWFLIFVALFGTGNYSE